MVCLINDVSILVWVHILAISKDISRPVCRFVKIANGGKYIVLPQLDAMRLSSTNSDIQLSHNTLTPKKPALALSY